MSDTRQLIPIAGMVATAAVAVYMVVQLDAQTAARDFTKAAVADVRDARGQTILHGQFTPATDGDDTELKARLEPTGVDADARGEAEVEFTSVAPTSQEVEFSIEGVSPGTAFTFVIDGVAVATANSDRQGRVELEIDVALQSSR